MLPRVAHGTVRWLFGAGNVEFERDALSASAQALRLDGRGGCDRTPWRANKIIAKT